MNRLVKKSISIILAAIMIFSISSFSLAADIVDRGSQIPVILISGDGAPLSNANDEVLFEFSKMFSSDKLNKDYIVGALVNILKPYILEGLIADNFDNYYEAIETEIGKLFADVKLDKNGEVIDGSGIDSWRRWCNEDSQTNDHKGDKGYYGEEDYHFWYDWRRDPIAIADDLHTYIENIKRVTGSNEVCITCMCLGTNIVMAYISKYGLEGIHGVSFNGSVVGGSELLSEPLSGKFNFDGNAIYRFLLDSDEMDLFHIDQIVAETVDLLTKGGVFDGIEAYTKATVYDKVKKGVTSALALATFYTWPGYWAGVTAEDFETAKEYVFGEEGSKKRTEYAGLIEKLDNYHNEVRTKLPELLKSLKESDVNVAVIAKYGSQIGPICQSNEEIADQIASVKRASFGATTSSIYGTLSKEYIAARQAEGKGKYISPDKQIDASTCYFPDNTWFVKGARHSHWTKLESDLVYTVVTADKQLYIDDLDCSQFIVFDNKTQTSSPMTAENCNTNNWVADEEADKSNALIVRLKAFFVSFTTWVKSLIRIMSAKLAENQQAA